MKLVGGLKPLVRVLVQRAKLAEEHSTMVNCQMTIVTSPKLEAKPSQGGTPTPSTGRR